MKEINLTTEELNSIKSLYNVTHIYGEVSVYLLHDVIYSYLIRDDYVVVNYKEKRKEKYRYLIYGNEMDEEYVKYEFDLITLDNKKDFIDNYLGGARCTLKMKH